MNGDQDFQKSKQREDPIDVDQNETAAKRYDKSNRFFLNFSLFLV